MTFRDCMQRSFLPRSQFKGSNVLIGLADICVAVLASALTSVVLYLTVSAVAMLIILFWKRLGLPWQMSGAVVIAVCTAVSVVYSPGHINFLRNAVVGGSVGGMWWLHIGLRQVARDCKNANALVHRHYGVIAIAVIAAGFGWGGAFGLLSSCFSPDSIGVSSVLSFILLGSVAGMLVGVPYLLVWTVGVMLRRRMRR